MNKAGAQAAKPHAARAALLGVLAIAALAVATRVGQIEDRSDPGGIDTATTSERTVAVAGALAVLFFGIWAIRRIGKAVQAALDARGDGSRATAVIFVMSVIGYLTVGLMFISALAIPLEKILLGGAATGVILGIAAQQSLGNFFAGIVLLIARPFAVGDEVTIRSGMLGGEYNGVIVDMSMIYVHLMTENGLVNLPNAGVLAAASGPGAKTLPEEPLPPAPEGGITHGGPRN
ncbi:MAG: mechanosensitive ion channel domain-containing protein [Actinomycetota bacterium]